MKGQLFLTVKVRNDPGPTFPESGLGIGVDGVEVGFSDDVAVTARIAILRLREQTFILVGEMGASLQAVHVLFRPPPRPSTPCDWSPQHRHRQRRRHEQPSQRSSSSPEPFGMGRKPIHGCISAAIISQNNICFGHTCIGRLNTVGPEGHTSHNLLVSLSPSLITPALSNNVQISLARFLSSRRKNV